MADNKEKWGDEDVGDFIKTTHHNIYPTIDPSQVSLSQSRPFIVCIVGASRGIGAGIATSYAKAGATGLILASRRISGLEETAAACLQINRAADVQIISCDVTSAESVQALANAIKEKFQRLDVLVYNSGYSGDANLRAVKGDPSSLQTAINVNYVGAAFCAMSFVPLLLATENGAKAFIAVNSMAAFIVRGQIANTQYCVAKAAQLKYMEHVHEESHKEGLVAVSVHPGAVWTEMAEETAPKEFKEYCIDDVELCGAWCVWVTKEPKPWLSGRFANANWDVHELMCRKQEILDRDLLKMKVTV